MGVALFWVAGGEWRGMGYSLGVGGVRLKYWGIIGGGGEWGWVHCLIMPK